MAMGVWCDYNTYVLFTNKFLHTRVFGWVMVLRVRCVGRDSRTKPRRSEPPVSTGH